MLGTHSISCFIKILLILYYLLLFKILRHIGLFKEPYKITKVVRNKQKNFFSSTPDTLFFCAFLQ